VLKPRGKLLTADIDRPSTASAWIAGWLGRFFLLQPELIDNLRGEIPGLIRDAGFEKVSRLAHVHGMISVFSAIK